MTDSTIPVRASPGGIDTRNLRCLPPGELTREGVLSHSGNCSVPRIDERGGSPSPLTPWVAGDKTARIRSARPRRFRSSVPVPTPGYDTYFGWHASLTATPARDRLLPGSGARCTVASVGWPRLPPACSIPIAQGRGVKDRGAPASCCTSTGRGEGRNVQPPLHPHRDFSAW